MTSLNQEGDLEKVKYLCEAGADIRTNNDYAVEWASQNGHIQVVKYLCENGADILKISEAHKKYISFCLMRSKTLGFWLLLLKIN